MDEWVGTREAEKIKKVGLCQHSIARLAKLGEVVAKRAGKKKWLVKVTFNNNRWDLVKLSPPVPVEQSQVITEPTSEKIGQDTLLIEHFNELAGIARTLAFRQKWLLDNQQWLFYNNFPRFSGTIDWGIKATGESAARYNKELAPPIDLILSKLLLLHFNWQFRELALDFWHKIPAGKEKQVVDKLTVLGYGKAFTICPTCPVCQSLCKA